MTEILLVRHGQASFGAADYDVLSATGVQQALRLGARLAAAGVRPARVIAGTLRRQRETAAAIARAYAEPLPEVETHPGLDEYDSDALVAGWQAAGGEIPERGDHVDRRAHFRALALAMAAWQAGGCASNETFAAFEARVAAALAEAGRPGPDGPVLVVSSGGVIGQIVRTCMAAPAEMMVRVNLQTANASVTRLVAGRSATRLTGWNDTAHLEGAEGLVTFS